MVHKLSIGCNSILIVTAINKLLKEKLSGRNGIEYDAMRKWNENLMPQRFKYEYPSAYRSSRHCRQWLQRRRWRRKKSSVMLVPEEHFVYGRLKTIYGYESIARARVFFAYRETHTQTHTSTLQCLGQMTLLRCLALVYYSVECKVMTGEKCNKKLPAGNVPYERRHYDECALASWRLKYG